MTQKIYKDGTDQYIMTRLGSINNTTGAQGILLGASEGYSLSTLIDNIIVVFSEYKTEDESIAPDIRWNSTAGMWKINIPHENITQLGTSWLNISGYDDSGISIIPVAIEVEVTSHMSYHKLLTDSDFTINTTAKTILFSDTLIKAGHILKIRNVSKNADVYISEINLGRTIKETSTPGLFTYSYDGDMSDTDIIQIFINKT